jgi:hypothetical protein
MRRRLALVVLFALVSSAGAAQPGPDPLMRVPSTDPLELARVVDREGDGAVLRRLEDGTMIAVLAVAVVAAPEMRAPETSLERLAELARGRDPDLAPRAAASALTIARALRPEDLDARECDRASLGPARASLEALAADATARADLRRAASLAAAALADLGAPAS